MKKTKQPKQTESEIRNAIKCYLELKGWRVLRMGAMIYGKKGIADLLCMRWGITLWIETKSKDGELSDDQKKFAYEVEQGGCLYVIARSKDFAIKCADNIEFAFCDLSGEVSDTIKPDKRMKLICNLSDKRRK